MKKAYVIVNPSKDRTHEGEKRICEELQKNHIEYQVQTKEQQDGHYTNMTDIPEGTDFILVLGGDGTILEAARDTVNLDLPIIGVNKGTLGYLTEIELEKLSEAISLIANGEYQIGNRMMVLGEVVSKNGDTCFDHALNDIVITRAGHLQVIQYEIYVNGHFLAGYSADGIIVSTPTGSTGYNLSAGGPIVEPEAELMVVTPICPHTLNTRSIVLSSQDEVELRISEGRMGNIQKVLANFDGAHVMEMETGDVIRIRKAKRAVRIMKLNERSFLEVLHRKMNANN